MNKNWQSTVTCLLLSLIVGILSYVQYEKWELKQKQVEAREWKEKMDSAERVSDYMYELKLKELSGEHGD